MSVKTKVKLSKSKDFSGTRKAVISSIKDKKASQEVHDTVMFLVEEFPNEIKNIVEEYNSIVKNMHLEGTLNNAG